MFGRALTPPKSRWSQPWCAGYWGQQAQKGFVWDLLKGRSCRHEFALRCGSCGQLWQSLCLSVELYFPKRGGFCLHSAIETEEIMFPWRCPLVPHQQSGWSFAFHQLWEWGKLYLSTRNDLQKQEFVLTKRFVDHKGRVSGSIQKAFLHLMVNSFKSLAGCIQGRAEQSDWSAGISEAPAKCSSLKRKIRNVAKINLVINYEVEKSLPSISPRAGRRIGVHWGLWWQNPIQKVSSLLWALSFPALALLRLLWDFSAPLLERLLLLASSLQDFTANFYPLDLWQLCLKLEKIFSFPGM